MCLFFDLFFFSFTKIKIKIALSCLVWSKKRKRIQIMKSRHKNLFLLFFLFFFFFLVFFSSSSSSWDIICDRSSADSFFFSLFGYTSIFVSFAVVVSVAGLFVCLFCVCVCVFLSLSLSLSLSLCLLEVARGSRFLGSPCVN